MTTQQKLIKQKLSLLELGDFLNNVSDACRIHGCSRQHFCDIKKAYLSQGLVASKRRAVVNLTIRIESPPKYRKRFF